MLKKCSLFIIIIALIWITNPVLSQTPPLLPKKYQQLTKTISDGSFCMGDYCEQKNVEEYYRDRYYMTINTAPKVKLYGDSEMKQDLKTLQSFLNNQVSYTNSDVFKVFNKCMDFACVPLGEINNVSYPGMDTCRAVYTIETQNSYEGALMVNVFASKGNQYVLLSTNSLLATHDTNDKPNSLYKQCLQQLGISDDYGYDDKFLNCYRKNLQNNQQINSIMKKMADDLIDFFAIY